MNSENKVPGVLLKKAEELEKYYSTNYPKLAPLAKQCFLNTMETTVKKLDDGSYFVITGDIEAMWLRDSASQVMVYVRYANEDEHLAEILEGVILKQAEQVAIDPYANAFNESASGRGHKDKTILNDAVWERKFEIDSLCSPLYLAYRFWKETGRTRVFDQNFKNMMISILDVFETEQNHDKSPYTFERDHCRRTDTLVREGRGTPVKADIGLIWSGFRPSDDCCEYGYLIPSNMMAVCALKYAEEILETVYKDNKLAKRCRKLWETVEEAINKYAVVDNEKYGRMYAFEVDGFGNANLMDDANSPSLLAIPYLGYRDISDELYRNTRKFCLSKDDPYYYTGSCAEGIGSIHTQHGFVWHIAIVMRALTSDNRDEIMEALDMLSKTHAGTNFMHESFNPDDPTKFSRHWFAWANSLFAELLIRLKEKDFFEK